MTKIAVCLIVLLSALTAGCMQSAPPQPRATADVQTVSPAKLLAMPETLRGAPTRTKSELARAIHALNPVIGSYPPKFRSDADRAQTYRQWSDLLSDARAYEAAEGQSEASYFYLAELYRQGHNLDVLGSAGEAERNIEACIGAFPHSKPCHFSAIYFYLSLQPDFAHRAERSLTFLRAALAPTADLNVERHYIILYLYQEKLPEALAQMEYYLATFPEAPDRKMWETMVRAAADGSLEFKQTFH